MNRRVRHANDAGERFVGGDTMDVRIDGDHDDDTIRAIVTALSQHLGKQVRVVETDGAGTGNAEEGAILTDREQRLREEIEDLLSGGPERGHEKIEALEKLFVRERMETVFDEIAYEDGTFAGYAADDRTPADGLIAGVGEIDGRDGFFHRQRLHRQGGLARRAGHRKGNPPRRTRGHGTGTHRQAHRLDGGPAHARRARRIG